MNYTKPERLSLKLHNELDEKWIQKLIADEDVTYRCKGCGSELKRTLKRRSGSARTSFGTKAA
jgi:hypothetical protein